MNNNDEEEFVGFLAEKFNTLFIEGKYYDNTVDNISYLKESNLKSTIILRKIYLINQSISIVIKYEFDENKKKYYPDDISSFIVEFIRSVIKGDILKHGRLYVPWDSWKFNKMDESKIREMLKWYGQLERWIKKRYKKIPNDFRYIGPHALEEFKQGKIKLINIAPATFYRVDTGESGETYNRFVEQIDEEVYFKPEEIK